MNYKQINSLENGDCLQLTEDYEYKTDIKNFIIKKGTRMVLVGCSLSGFTFTFEQRNIDAPYTFGKKRLHKMKVKIIGKVHL